MFYHHAPYNPMRLMYVFNAEIVLVTETAPFKTVRLMVAKMWYLFVS